MELGEGTVAVVTGAGSGIGLAMSHALAARGCAVVLADVQVDALEDAAAAIEEHGVDSIAVPTDVSRQEAVESLAHTTLERFGAVHVVCNNAGVAGGGDPWFGPIEGWEWTMGVNFWGVVHGCRTFLPHLVGSGGGHFVNTASMAGLYPGFSPAYDASKHAVVAISESLYHAMRDAQIPVGVSVLCPGWVRTNILDAERNWPSEFGAVPERNAGAEVARSYVQRAIDEGMQPAAVADLVITGIAEDRYWILPHQDFVEIAMERFASIGDGSNPVRPEETPGMPPRSQIIAEVMAALDPTTPS